MLLAGYTLQEMRHGRRKEGRRGRREGGREKDIDEGRKLARKEGREKGRGKDGRREGGREGTKEERKEGRKVPKRMSLNRVWGPCPLLPPLVPSSLHYYRFSFPPSWLPQEQLHCPKFPALMCMFTTASRQRDQVTMD